MRHPELVPVVVDDDELSRHVLVRRLLRWGYDPIAFPAADAALAYLRSGEPVCAVVADVDMPDVDGLELARAVRTVRADLPVFLVTPSPSPELCAQALAAGARDVLPKQAGSGETLRWALAAALAPGGADDVGLAHALRTPLTALKGALDILANGHVGALPETQQRFVGIAQRNADRMIALVERLLASSARP